MDSRLTPDHASRFARLTLEHLGRQYPYKPDLVLIGPEPESLSPAALHPIFHGSYDWHSCVHGWWQVLRLARRFPDMAEAHAIRQRADAMLVPGKVAGEIARLDRPHSAGFERPYGWAWALALHREAALHAGTGWGAALEPLARRFAAGFADYLPKLTYPIWTGTHFNTAFALVLALDWAREHDGALAVLIEEWARDRYAPLTGWAAPEPGGDEFLSPSLIVALLMARILPRAEFAAWFEGFFPDASRRFVPAKVSDRSDGKIAHLDGLNLSRAWCMRGIDAVLGTSALEAAALRHLDASLPHLADDYMGTHWLASFALLALDGL